MISSYDEAVMDLMIKVEESERYLQKYRKSVGAVIVVENGEEEQYPSFSIKRKDKEDPVQIREFFRREEMEEETDDRAEYEKMNVTTVKLTLWEDRKSVV